MFREWIVKNIKWFSQGCLRFDFGGKIIYTDPFDIESYVNDADYIFISHSHFDHFSLEDIQKVIKKDTVFIFPKSMKKEAGNFSSYQVIYILPGDCADLAGKIAFTAEYAYNINKTQCHPKENEWVGYMFEYDGKRFYYTSDTELIPEMNDVKADVIFLPLGQTYTMDSVEDAVKAVEVTGAKIAVPIHYGKYEGTVEDAEKFKTLLDGKAEVIIL